jgi:hypothetical protein
VCSSIPFTHANYAHHVLNGQTMRYILDVYLYFIELTSLYQGFLILQS